MANLQITIDDGPLPLKGALTPILEELARRKVKAAFFNLGSEVSSDPAAAVTIHTQGHILGNHSWSHLMRGTANYTDAELLKEFSDTHNTVLTATRVSMLHWRAPRLEEIQRLSKILTAGRSPLYKLSHCDSHADSKDSQGVTKAADMLAALLKDISGSRRNSCRLLFHVKPETATAFKTVLSGLEAAGHTLVDFSQDS